MELLLLLLRQYQSWLQAPKTRDALPAQDESEHVIGAAATRDERDERCAHLGEVHNQKWGMVSEDPSSPLWLLHNYSCCTLDLKPATNSPSASTGAPPRIITTPQSSRVPLTLLLLHSLTTIAQCPHRSPTAPPNHPPLHLPAASWSSVGVIFVAAAATPPLTPPHTPAASWS